MKKSLSHSHLLFIALGLAIIFHLLIIVFVNYYNERNPYLTTFDPARVYPVQISGSANDVNKAQSTSTVKKPIRKNSGSLTGVALNSTESLKSEKLSGDGTGTEIGGPGLSLQSTSGATPTFDQAIQSFERPGYPAVARQRGLEGTVTLRLKITPEGEAIEPQIIKSSGHESLDQSALAAAIKWRFHKRKTPDFILVDKTIVFKLNN